MEFLEVPAIFDFSWWRKTKLRLEGLSVSGVLALSFRFFDVNADRYIILQYGGFVCSSDLF